MLDAYDVVVSGSGPSGSRAAFLCARAGLSVALLERAELPRDKCCAGGLLVRAMGLLGEQTEGMPFERSIAGVSIVLDGKAHHYHAGMELGRTVRRADFDAFLAKGARQAGCDLLTGTALRGVREEGRGLALDTRQGGMRASYLILAEGCASGNASRLLGSFPRGGVLNGVSLHCRGGQEEGMAAFLLPGKRWLPELLAAGAGICASFPTRQGVVLSTIGRASSSTLLAALRGTAARLGMEPMGEGCAHPIPVAMRPSLARGRCLAVGDCAGLASPFSGEGLTPALDSAGRAAQAVVASLKEGHPLLQAYERDMRSRAGRDQLMARMSGAAIGLAVGGRWAQALLSGLEGDPACKQAMAAVATQEHGGRAFLARTLPRLPWLLARGAR